MELQYGFMYDNPTRSGANTDSQQYFVLRQPWRLTIRLRLPDLTPDFLPRAQIPA